MKLNNTLKSISFAAVLMAGFSSCKKDKMPDIVPGPISTIGVYVLNEAYFSDLPGTNNSSISYYDIATKTVEKDYFKKQNSTSLGANANDLQQYGSKLYCVVLGTTKAAKDSYLEVMSIATGKSIKRIPFSDATEGFLPRYVVFNKDKAYVSSYDGKITKIDTASLAIESRVLVGGALEQMAVVNNKLYVVNSAHFQYGTADNSSVSVVDLNTFTKSKSIPVGYNPTNITATKTGELFVITKGNYADIKASVDKISSVTDTKVTSNDKASLEFLAVNGTKAYSISTWPNYFLKEFSLATNDVGSDFIKDDTKLGAAYGLTVNPLTQDVFIGDSKASQFFCFSADGKKKFSFDAGLMPKLAAFRYGY
ncbi:YncE family protein [Pedobacter caeni]|uniref:40-residue YVTN family beta-propeller repeat-containing protein n=1 Tax=Pedobacter caeni TaxID=288992 RepID=A0A1M4WYF2_9SPHI|nr:DUF5074 domain-containing protein [Pedobacter caeni]SHE86284.1 hypothetical protein SAMN04488522_1011433 [Pedobacter caeni]